MARINKAFLVFSLVFVALVINAATAEKKTVSLTGNVFDAVTKEPLTVFIIAKNSDGDIVAATRSDGFENGSYTIENLQPNEDYTILIKKKDYFLEKYDFDTRNCGNYAVISHDFLVKPLYEGVKIPISVPPFELNKSKLRYGIEAILEPYAKTLKNNKEVEVQIQCYPDNNKDLSANEKLTSERCKSLINYFISKGLNPSRLTMKNFKKTDPGNPPPEKKQAKGKRYIGTSYIVVTDINNK